MRYDEINQKLKDASFDFFYWFSRFEFLLKKYDHLKSREEGDKAEPNWEHFISNLKGKYKITEEAKELLLLHPKRQVVGASSRLVWRRVGIQHCNNDLCRVATMLRTIRNNLFHGGKHGDLEVDDKERNLKLLLLGKTVLDQFAEQFDYEGDYYRRY